MKKPIATVILSVFAAATNITYSQEPTAPTVTDQQTELLKRMELLKQMEGIHAKFLAQEPKNAVEARIRELRIENYPVGLEILNTSRDLLNDSSRNVEKMPIKELVNALLAINAASPLAVKIIKRDSNGMKMSGLKGHPPDATLRTPTVDPEWEKYNLTPWDAVASLKIIDPSEDKGVSLKAKLQELKFNPQQQVGETCALYATFHATQFALLDKGKPCPKIAQLTQAYKGVRIGDRYSEIDMWRTIPSATGKRPVTQWCIDPAAGSSLTLAKEIAKHELKNGRPVLASMSLKNTDHVALVIGYKYDSELRIVWEVQDSNTLYQDGGIKEWNDIRPIYSIRFE